MIESRDLTLSFFFYLLSKSLGSQYHKALLLKLMDLTMKNDGNLMASVPHIAQKHNRSHVVK